MAAESNRWDRIRLAYEQGRLFNSVYFRLRPFLSGAKHLVYNPAGNRIRLHLPEKVQPSQDPGEIEIVRRVFESFKKMKKDQAGKNPVYHPSSLWQAQLDESYAPFKQSLESNDINKFHFFLSNFGVWDKYLGVESTTFLQSNMRLGLLRRYLKNVVYFRQGEIWNWFYGGRKPISTLYYPQHGNQSGAFFDGIFIGINPFFNEIYSSILSNILSDRNRPVIGELGGGYGKFAYFLLRNFEESAYMDFDLPETLCLAAYYLMRAFPGKKVLLYGESEFKPESVEKFDLIFMPSFEITKIGSSTADLFINQNSLGEMTKDAAANYVSYIAESTRYFFHMNHDRFPHRYALGDFGLLAYEYPVPEDKFKLLFRYPELGHMFYRGGVDFGNDIFLYLYEKKGRG